MTWTTDLDQMLADAGEDIILRRTVGTGNQTNIDCPCRALVRGYKPEDLAGRIIQGASTVIISGTDIIRAQWPGGVAQTGQTDPRVPRKGDKAIIAGKVRNVEHGAPVYLGGELHRIDIVVTG